MKLGALTKEMRAKGLEPKPKSPLRGYSIVASMDAARSIRSPQWSSTCSRKRGVYGSVSHSCNLGVLIKSEIDGLKEMMNGLTLYDFDERRSLGHPRVLWR
jgi:hypothetical protein